jgi:predicted dehydrogenase
MEPTRFAIIGSGWRADYYLRIARALPDRFAITGLFTRSEATRAATVRDWGIPTPSTLDELLASKPDFVVLCVSWPSTPVLLAELVGRGIAVLTETPPAPDVDGLRALAPLAAAGARIQVAEQYQFQPLHAARLAIARSGRLGTISQVQVSAAHGYHGIDLIRRFLDDTFGPVTIRAQRFESTIVAGPDRSGPPREERIVPSSQVIATLEFDGGEVGGAPRLAVFDFTDDQYFSWIRSNRVLVRGDRGEIHDTTVRYLADATTPITIELLRHDTGHDANLEGLGFKGITFGSEWLVRTEFPAARLSDDELAVATCLARMGEYVDGGPGYCDLADGVQDHYLGLMIDAAAASGEPVRVSGHLWDGRT